nr:hypothetical protein CFP56_14135 [Quercus suber]
MFEFGAVDLGYNGSKFTWAKGKWGNASIKRRLDRGIANISWRLAFPNATISHLGAIRSDHAPILLDTNPQSTFAHRPFRFEAAWLRDNRCQPVIAQAWKETVGGSDFIKLCKKQATTRDVLRKWNKEVFGKCQDKINLLIQKIKETQEHLSSYPGLRQKISLISNLSLKQSWLVGEVSVSPGPEEEPSSHQLHKPCPLTPCPPLMFPIIFVTPLTPYLEDSGGNPINRKADSSHGELGISSAILDTLAVLDSRKLRT